MTIAENINARHKYSDSLERMFDKFGATVCLTAAEAEERLFGIVYKQPGMLTIDDCKESFQRVFDERGKMEADAVLSRFGIWKMSDLPVMLIKDFWLYCQSIITYGASPFYGWDINKIQDRIRDRWLLWHPESDSLWEVRGKLSDELESGEVSDVTGIVEHEQRFLKTARRFGDPLPEVEEEL